MVTKTDEQLLIMLILDIHITKWFVQITQFINLHRINQLSTAGKESFNIFHN